MKMSHFSWIAICIVLGLTAGLSARLLWVAETEPAVMTASDIHSNREQAQTDNKTLPAFELLDLQGGIKSQDSWPGKILIVNFWATWCPPCRKEMPDFVRFMEEHKDQPVQIIGIAIDDPQLVRDFAATLGINYPILLALNNGLSLNQAMGNKAGVLPFTAIFTAEGKRIYQHAGEISKQQLETLISPYLEGKMKEN